MTEDEDTIGELDVERIVPIGVAGFSVGDVPIGDVAGLSVACGEIRLPGVAGLGAAVDCDEGSGVGLNGDDEGVDDEIGAAAGRTGGAAGLDGIGEVGCDEGGGSFSVTVPAITAGPERESG